MAWLGRIVFVLMAFAGGTWAGRAEGFAWGTSLGVCGFLLAIVAAVAVLRYTGIDWDPPKPPPTDKK